MAIFNSYVKLPEGTSCPFNSLTLREDQDGRRDCSVCDPEKTVDGQLGAGRADPCQMLLPFISGYIWFMVSSMKCSTLFKLT